MQIPEPAVTYVYAGLIGLLTIVILILIVILIIELIDMVNLTSRRVDRITDDDYVSLDVYCVSLQNSKGLYIGTFPELFEEGFVKVRRYGRNPENVFKLMEGSKCVVVPIQSCDAKRIVDAIKFFVPTEVLGECD